MPKTESSPLTIVQKQADVIKKAVEKLIKECNKVIKDKKLKDKDVKFKQLYKECYQSKKDVKSVHGRAEALIEEDEPKKVKNYSNKKDFEVNRLFNLEKQLNELMPKLCPDEDEEMFVKQLKEAGELSDEPVNEDGDDDDDDEGEDEVDNAKESQEEEKIKDKDTKDDGKKDKKDKKKDKDKKKKDKTSKDDDKEDDQKVDKDDEEEVEKDKGKKDKKNKDKDKKNKDKADKDKDKEDDIENKDKDDKKKKDKKKDKDKDKKEKDLEKEKKEKELEKEKKEKDKKGKDKKDKDKKSKEKDAKDDKKTKDDNKKKKVIEVPKEEELEDFEDSEDEDDSEEDDDGIAEEIDEEIDGDDEESEEDSEEEDVRQKIVQQKSKVVEQQMIKKQDVQQQQAKPSPKDEIENLQSMDYDDDDESEEEESEDDDVADNKIEQIEDVIVPHSSASVQSAPVPKKTSPRVAAVPKKDSPRVAAVPKKDSPKVAEKEEDDDDDEYEDEDDEEDEEDEEDEDDDGEEEESEEEEDDEAGDNTLEITQPTTRFVAIDDFEAAEDGDLSVKQGEIIHIVEVREDGWWVGENEKGEKGLVPKTYLQMYNQYKDIQQQDEGDETKEHDNESEEEGEGHKEKEDGDDEQQTPSKRKSGRELWGSVKKTVNETLVSDVLHAMGAGPSGFRLPTLSKYFNESNKFRMQNFLTPKLSTSNLGFRDLFVNPASGQMRPTEVRVERVITISSCQQIPPPAAGIIVQRRYVRMCLFDGQNVLSNIHTVRVAAEDKTERNWSFNSRITDTMDVQLHNELFVRTNSAQTNVGILFELCISCVKSKTEERGEFSCGWAHLPLTDKTGLPIPSKSCDLYVNGGTPYERDIEVDPSVSRRASSNALVSLISGNKQPRLLVKVGLPNKEQKAQLDLLPETLVGDICLLPFYTYYRQILADKLVIQRLDLDSTEPIHSPFLHQFPQVADHPDLMSLLRETWVNKLKSVKRAERSKVCTVTGFDILRDVEVLKKLFEEVFMESVYPVISASSFVRYKTGNTDIEMKRKNTIEKFSQVKRERKSALAALLASDIVYTPFDMSEVTFNVVNPYSLYETFVPVPVEG